MKRVRLELPREFKRNHGYLKIIGNATEPFFDTRCKNSVSKERCISLDVEIPEETELLGVTPPNANTICQKIADNWIWLFHAGWDISEGLKKVLIIMDGKVQEVAVSGNGVQPDVEDWLTHRNDEWWDNMLWGIVVYVTNSRTYGILHWNTELVKDVWKN